MIKNKRKKIKRFLERFLVGLVGFGVGSTPVVVNPAPPLFADGFVINSPCLKQPEKIPLHVTHASHKKTMSQLEKAQNSQKANKNNDREMKKSIREARRNYVESLKFSERQLKKKIRCSC